MPFVARPQDKYLQGRTVRIRKILIEAAAVAEAISAAAGGHPLTSAALKAVNSPASWGFDDSQAPSLQQFFESLDERVVNALQVRDSKVKVQSQSPKSNWTYIVS